MSNLKNLSQLYKANKFELGYIDVYEKYFENLKDKELKILEIGIDKGPSLKVWSDYFKNSKIIGLDIKPVKLDIKNVELSKIETRYDKDTLSAIDKFSSSLIKRILKDPISILKSQASNGHYSPVVVDAIRSIYQLDEILEPAKQD